MKKYVLATMLCTATLIMPMHRKPVVPVDHASMQAIMSQCNNKILKDCIAFNVFVGVMDPELAKKLERTSLKTDVSVLGFIATSQLAAGSRDYPTAIINTMAAAETLRQEAREFKDKHTTPRS